MNLDELNKYLNNNDLILLTKEFYSELLREYNRVDEPLLGRLYYLITGRFKS